MLCYTRIIPLISNIQGTKKNGKLPFKLLNKSLSILKECGVGLKKDCRWGLVSVLLKSFLVNDKCAGLKGAGLGPVS